MKKLIPLFLIFIISFCSPPVKTETTIIYQENNKKNETVVQKTEEKQPEKMIQEEKPLFKKMYFINDTAIQPIDPDQKLKVTVIFISENMNPDEDLDSYAMIYTDKREVGPTEQKLLSQTKTLIFYTTYEKHLLNLEVFLQDPFKKAWQRLKNIDQPKPKYFAPKFPETEITLIVKYDPKEKGLKQYSFEGDFISE
ncbi:MAG TPA: hypothetical protein DHW82_07710 [Spirochaetia bacterium]|nr:MAG: hypothetical protein A2Y41_02400 [Spirochaetes bacterium GWB1_36_13]HCL56880.1 hypothetical protein [Spirochaetia bacterium]